jgi:predicted MPP superfamily phosphohydrolase
MLVKITRRSLLKSTASLCGAAAMLNPFDLFAEEKSTIPTDDVWTFISDMHLADWTEKPPEYNVRFQAVIAALLAEPIKPRRLFLIGDNVASGTPGQYKRLLEILKPVTEAGIGIHAALGNHDHREHFQAICTQLLPTSEQRADSITHIVRTAPWQDGEVKHLEIIETKRADFFVLDSLDKTGQSEGKFGKNQLDWLAAELDKRKDKPVILLAHHPAVNIAQRGLADSIPFWKLLESRHQVKAYFFGHTHVWSRSRLGRIHQVNVPATSYCVDMTVLGWVSMTLRDDGVDLTLKTSDPNHARNGEKVNLTWR